MDLQAVLGETFLYRFFTWQLKPFQQYLTLALSQVFFYLYLYRGHSLISLLSLYVFGLLLWGLVKPEGSGCCTEECIGEESIKRLYIALYVALNKGVQYMRTTILAKNGMKDVVVRDRYPLYK